MVGALAEPDQRDIGTFSRRRRPDILDIDLASDHLMPETGDDPRDELQAIPSLVRDQNAEVLSFPITHRPQFLPYPDPFHQNRVLVLWRFEW